MPELRRNGSLARVNRDGCGGGSRHLARARVPQHLLPKSEPAAGGVDALDHGFHFCGRVDSQQLFHLGAFPIPVLEPYQSARVIRPQLSVPPWTDQPMGRSVPVPDIAAEAKPPVNTVNKPSCYKMTR